jgi:hypothetical protein
VYFLTSGMHIFIRLCEFLSQNYDFHRDKVKPLIEHVSGAQFQSYPTHTDAVAAYKRNKGMGLVRVVRDPGDDEIYGPMFYAVQ